MNKHTALFEELKTFVGSFSQVSLEENSNVSYICCYLNLWYLCCLIFYFA